MKLRRLCRAIFQCLRNGGCGALKKNKQTKAGASHLEYQVDSPALYFYEFRIPSTLRRNIKIRNSHSTKNMGGILINSIDLFRPIQTYLQ